MKVLKAALCLFLALFILPAPANTAKAEAAGGYARADTRNALFCSEKSLEKALFAVPYTYCVEILAEDGDWYYVQYAQDVGLYKALKGFCRKDSLTRVSVPPENVYLNYPVEVKYSAAAPDNSLPTLGQISVIAAYYGVYYRDGLPYSYVLYDGDFGYVQGAHEDYPLNKIPATTPSSGASEGNAKLVTALVIAALAVAAIVVLFYTGKRKRAQK